MTADLEAARERLEQLIEMLDGLGVMHKDANPGMAAEHRSSAGHYRTILTALDQAAEALKPFEAVMREHYEDLLPDPNRHAWGFNGADLYWRDFILAATVYATLKPVDTKEGEG